MYEKIIDFEIKKIKNLVFDVGGVLIGYRWEEMFEDYGLDKISAIKIGKGIFDSKEWPMFDAGLISLEETVESFCNRNPDLAEPARWFIENAIKMRVPREKLWKELRRLKEKGYKIYLLSNYSKVLFKLHTSDYDFMNIIDGKVVSYEVNSLKPEEKIYRTLFERYNLKEDECVFFDDRPCNVEMAKKLGMEGIVVKDQSEQFLISILEHF